MAKKPITLSDKISKLFIPDAGSGSDESGDEAAPKFSEFDEVPDGPERSSALSEIRKRNIKFLEDIDQKYEGAISSRKEAFGEEGASDEDGGDDFDEDSDDDDFDDGEVDDESVAPTKEKRKSILFIKQPSSDEQGSDESDGDEESESNSEEHTEESHDEDETVHGYTQPKEPSEQRTKLITDENRQEAIGKGLAVQNQLKLWERMLEMRIKVQPCLVSANSLPAGVSFEKFCTDSDQFRKKANQATKSITEALDALLSLQEKLFEGFAETKNLLKSGSKRKSSSSTGSSNAKRATMQEYEKCIASRTNDMAEYRNSVLLKWHDRTKIAASVRNQKQSVSVLKKIEDSLINREELVRKTQLYRGGHKLLGRLEEIKTVETKSAQGNATLPDQAETPVYDGEIYDDSDFYHQLLRELIEYKTNTTDSPQEIANKLVELQKLRSKMKKNVDTRATKGRKIRYVVHNKLVNFMAPVPDYEWTDEAKDELFGSLFGKISASTTQ
ncbi:protein Aatf [Anopheles bellator]|uniref:protein Aatf n=1 Tax=Anopheles bellator TaxID=139047 RepID=UPI0026485475|nr:protein Aatf [Anopheles bellator]